jgi:hypothetical protein
MSTSAGGFSLVARAGSSCVCAGAARAVQKIRSCLGYSGRGGNVFGKAARDPNETMLIVGRNRLFAATGSRCKAYRTLAHVAAWSVMI